MKKTITTALILLAIASLMCCRAEGDDGPKPIYEDFTDYFIVLPLMRIIFIFGRLGPWMHNYGSSFSNNFDRVILANPSVLDQNAPLYNASMANLMGLPIRLLTPVYELAILAVAIYLLFLPASSSGRAGAKSLLTKLIISMIFFSASPAIFEAMMQTSHNLAKTILTDQVVEKARVVFQGGIWAGYWIMAHVAMSDTELGIPFWGSLYAMGWVPYIIIFVRYIMVTMLGMVFPIGILLYSTTSFFRGIGKKILELSFVWIFMQVFLASAVASIALGSNLYNLIPPENNTALSGINVVPAPDPREALNVVPYITPPLLNQGSGWVWSESTPMHTTIIAYALGSAAYGLMIAVPLMMVRLLGHFLP